MVNQKKALQRFWKDVCSVFIQDKKVNEVTKRTEFVETALFENQPCKLSFETLTSSSETDHAPSVTQGVKLFLDNEHSVPAGSKIVVVRNSDEIESSLVVSDEERKAIERFASAEITVEPINKTFIYKASGEPGVYTNHQEIPLVLFEGWA